jgi:hydrogenase/urease accessory protein HupE
MSGGRRVVLVGLAMLAVLVVSWGPRAASAHPLRFGVLSVTELAPGRVDVRLRISGTEADPVTAEPLLPDGCVPVAPPVRHPLPNGAELRFVAGCPRGALDGGRVGAAIEEPGTQVRLRVTRGDRVESFSLDAERPTVVVGATPDSTTTTIGRHAQLGVGHVLGGVDHLLFVLGLVLLVGLRARLLTTITAFTVGHSVTLALATFDVVQLPARPVETCIALSVLLLAVELTRRRRDEPAVPARHPELVAVLFGLLHGLGFAGALLDLGIAADELPAALLGFNLGVELGQLLFVAAALGVYGAVVRLRSMRFESGRLQLVVPYAMGATAVWLVLDRVAVIVQR